MGGGLGGGSSDAATMLLALDRLWGTGFGAEALAEIGVGLGADVPFFLFGRPAWVEGIGDRLRAGRSAPALVRRPGPSGGGADAGRVRRPGIDPGHGNP